MFWMLSNLRTGRRSIQDCHLYYSLHFYSISYNLSFLHLAKEEREKEGQRGRETGR